MPSMWGDFFNYGPGKANVAIFNRAGAREIETNFKIKDGPRGRDKGYWAGTATRVRVGNP